MTQDIRQQISQWIGRDYIDGTTRRLLQTAMEEIERLNETIRLQANAARTGMDAARRAATILYAEADKARAESSPDVLASERQANALLTEENERLQKDAERYQWLKAHWGHRTPILNGMVPNGAADDAFDAGIDCAIEKAKP